MKQIKPIKISWNRSGKYYEAFNPETNHMTWFVNKEELELHKKILKSYGIKFVIKKQTK